MSYSFSPREKPMMYCSLTCLSSDLWPCFKITSYAFEVITLCTENLRVVLEDLHSVLRDELSLYPGGEVIHPRQDRDLYLLCRSSGGRWTHPDNAWGQTLLPPPCKYWTPPPECWWLQTGLSLSPTQHRFEREISMVLELIVWLQATKSSLAGYLYMWCHFRVQQWLTLRGYSSSPSVSTINILAD